MPGNKSWTKKEIVMLQRGVDPEGRTQKACELMRWKLRRKLIAPNPISEEHAVPKTPLIKKIFTKKKTIADAVYTLLDSKYSVEEVAKFTGLSTEKVTALKQVRNLI